MAKNVHYKITVTF